MFKWKRNPFVNKAGESVFAYFNLIKFRGWSIRIHRFDHADDAGCFHSHPAVAYRLILWGGYIEELYWKEDNGLAVFRTWTPGSFGKVVPDFEHRIHALLGKTSYSLWIRGPITHKVRFGCVD